MPSSPASDLAELVMPKLGLTMTEGLVTDWRVQPGDRVEAGDVLFVVETDKIANEVEAPSDGEIVEILVQGGDTVAVGTPLARWTGARIGGEGLQPEQPGPAGKPAPQPVRQNGGAPRVKATPLARRMAREQGVELSSVTGSGPRGRIKAADVEAARSVPDAAEKGRGSATVAERPPEESVSAAQSAAVGSARPAQGEAVTLSSRHLAMARRVARAKREIPHFYLTRQAEVSALLDLRRHMNAVSGPKVTVNHLVVKAVGRALLALPQANRIWAEDALLAFSTSDVGVVVNTENGLFIPVLRDVGRLPLDRLAATAADLVERTRNSRLGREDLEGGSVSVSNLGMAGIDSLTPIINPPQSAILGLGASSEVFRPDAEGRPALRREITLTLACDHRVFDGMSAARFLAAIAEGLESPHSLLLTRDP